MNWATFSKWGAGILATLVTGTVFGAVSYVQGVAASTRAVEGRASVLESRINGLERSIERLERKIDHLIDRDSRRGE